MELNTLGGGTGARSARLLAAGYGAPDVAESGVESGVKVEAASRFELALTASAAAGALVPCALLLYLFAREWQQETYYRAWLLLACVAPLGYVVRKAAHRVRREWERWGSIQVLIDATQSATLFKAVLQEIEDVAEASSDTSASEMESSTVYDKKLGLTQVQLRPWAREPLTLRLELPGRRRLTVVLSRGPDVVTGRDHSLSRCERMVLGLRSSERNRLADKAFLREWLLSCVEKYRMPDAETAEVIALDQASTDWIPEWQTRCVRRMKNSDGVGNGFYLKRKGILPILADAAIWNGKELRVYLIIGPPGSGKTELTIWLAGYLRVPLYRLSLNDARLSDQSFAQLVSPTYLQHDNAVIQIDEFQETLARWKGRNHDKGVSAGGFCEVLQGSNSLARGIVVLSGTQELAETMRDPAFAAVFRRISIAPTMLDWLSPDDLETFFCRFLLEFVPGCSEEELRGHARAFVGNKATWGRGTISIDMAKQFIMGRISGFCAAELFGDCPDPKAAVVVPAPLQQRFFEYLCQEAPAQQHLSAYPHVGSAC